MLLTFHQFFQTLLRCFQTCLRAYRSLSRLTWLTQSACLHSHGRLQSCCFDRSQCLRQECSSTRLSNVSHGSLSAPLEESLDSQCLLKAGSGDTQGGMKDSLVVAQRRADVLQSRVVLGRLRGCVDYGHFPARLRDSKGERKTNTFSCACYYDDSILERHEVFDVGCQIAICWENG